MKSVKDIERCIKKLKVESGDKIHHRVLDKLMMSLDESKEQTAVKQPNIWRIIMKSRITKLAAAAVMIVVVAILVVTVNFVFHKETSNESKLVETANRLQGPQVYQLKDGSKVKLNENAAICLYEDSSKRGFIHLAGEIYVTVTKGDRKFIVKTEMGDVTALGTEFNMDIVELGEASCKILAVEVDKGSVEVSNSQGVVIIKENQEATVERDQWPYDFRQDKKLPPRLVERIESMLRAAETGDKRMWLSNFNIKALYSLAKSEIEFSEHRDWFSGMSPGDANRFREALSDVNSPEQLAEIMLSGISDKIYKLYVRSVELDKDGKHAKAVCVKKLKQIEGLTPQWTFFDGDWWQTDD